jgi:hypothetical protein
VRILGQVLFFVIVIVFVIVVVGGLGDLRQLLRAARFPWW